MERTDGIRPATISRAARLALAIVVAAGCAGSGAAARPPARDPLDDTTAEEMYESGRRLAARGDLVRAEQYVATAIEMGYPGQRALPLLLQVCIQGRRYRSALGHARAHLGRDPTNWRLRSLVAALHSALGERERARSELERVLGDQPAAADAHYALALLLSESADRLRSRDHLRRYLELAPDGVHGADARARLDRDEPHAAPPIQEVWEP